jgi:DNA gyrase subunit A
VLYIAVAQGNDYGGYMLFAFENGKAAKVAFSGYATKTNRKKLISAYSAKSPPVAMYRITEDGDFVLTRGADTVMVMNSALISPNTAKNASGVQVFTLKKNTALTAMYPAPGAGLSADEIEYYRADRIPSAGHFRIKGKT